VNDELTEDELKEIEADAEKYHSGVENTFYHRQVLRLVEEVRKLRSQLAGSELLVDEYFRQS
jgi:hypothetical protein